MSSIMNYNEDKKLCNPQIMLNSPQKGMLFKIRDIFVLGISFLTHSLLMSEQLFEDFSARI